MITTVSDAWKAIRERFAAGWVIGSPAIQATPIQWPNQAFVPPRGTPWVRFEITAGDSSNAVVGITQVRSVGVVWVGIYVPVATGVSTALLFAEMAAAIFRNKTFSSIRCSAADIREAEESDGWRLVTVTIPYSYDIYYSESEDEFP